MAHRGEHANEDGQQMKQNTLQGPPASCPVATNVSSWIAHKDHELPPSHKASARQARSWPQRRMTEPSGHLPTLNHPSPRIIPNPI